MKCGLLFLVVLCTAASVAEDFIKSIPPAPAIAEFQFSTPQVGPEELANTMEQKKKTTKRHTTKPKPITTTTIKPTTTTAKPTTTTAKPTTTTAKPTTTTAKPTTTTAKPTTTTAKPTTTTAKPTTTTAKPTTTTAKPTTTTAKPTTTTGEPNTTTAKPNTTTSKPTTTTGKPTTTVKPVPPTPTPSAHLIMGKYNITKNGSICQLAQMALQIRLVSDKVNGTFIVQPVLTKTTTSACQEKTASLNITFGEGFILFIYEKNTTGNSVYVKELSFSLFYPFGTAAVKYSQRNDSLHLFAAQVGHSYSCRNESIYMGKGLYLDVNQDRMQAFNFTKSNEFGVSDPCPADVPTYSVAIAVGVILLVLIIVVVVAYVVGRRRRANGYQAL
ncbi:lysosome-associated membrane glycoprotein 2 [Gadus morhua]|uniref:Lysosome-associated membrane glycoprotein 2-like luminal domain-containing protein n=1 Tax=Gadus morhua TaxID=8049 RepID=A0A8C5CIY5_GADMO|nr:lysosome-associated membrane glycoprotein 2-like [Gadus morhua]